MSKYDFESSWQLHPRVSLREEDFGGLLYHFGTRQLSFLKDRVLLEIVNGLDAKKSLRDVMHSVGIPEDEMERYVVAVNQLADNDMLVKGIS